MEWFEDKTNKSFFNTKLLSVKKASVGSGVGVFCKKTQRYIRPEKDVNEEMLLLRVPKSMVLSAETCTISNLLYEERLSGLVGLVLAYIYEKQLKEKSPWYKYIQTINYHKKNGDLILPICLRSETEKAKYVGTEVEQVGGLDDEEIRESWEISKQFACQLKSKIGWEIPAEISDYMEFGAVVMMIGSRSFEIDNYIELALVPGADLFNHIKDGQQHVCFVTTGDVCGICGKDGCGHDEFGPPDSEEDEYERTSNCSDDDNHNDNDSDNDSDFDENLQEITPEWLAKLEQDAQDSWEQESVSSCSSSFVDPDLCCDIFLRRSINRGQEVFNNYVSRDAEFPNGILMAKYGFSEQK